MKGNPFSERLEAFVSVVREKGLAAAVVYNQANVRALTGIDCDNACLLVVPGKKTAKVVFHTDFRYVPMVHRLAPWLTVKDIKKVVFSGKKVGYESTVTAARYLGLVKKHPKTEFVDIDADVKALRAVKTPDEQEKLRAAEKLNDEIWSAAQAQFKPGMTEREMARVIQHLMIERGEGEAFETIVCVGKNAAECHHEPDETVWNGREPVLVDMGVKLNGFCSDLTRTIKPGECARTESQRRRGVRKSGLYWKVYDLVLEANEAAIAAAKPGMTGKQLDKVARDVIRKGGFGKCFGHSLGHGVGYEIHEAPYASKKGEMVLKPGMLVTIEPGIYLEDNLGVRIEDLVLITATGCEVLSVTAAK